MNSKYRTMAGRATWLEKQMLTPSPEALARLFAVKGSFVCNVPAAPRS